MNRKADYVLRESRKGHDGSHGCHWPGCQRAVAPAMWGCKEHWFRLPEQLRDRIWETYRPGQETTKDPSAEYLAVANEVQQWIGGRTE